MEFLSADAVLSMIDWPAPGQGYLIGPGPVD